jgi:predicted DNA binding CopG/RHH family protein
MAAQHRANKKTQETVYRVYRLPEELRKRVRAKREKAGVNLQSVIKAASLESLPKIVNTLKTMGLGFDGKKRPARLPMTDSLLGAFKVASKQTGIPASRLLQAALSLTCKGAK